MLKIPGDIQLLEDTAGVYAIENESSNHVYVGMSKDIKSRIASHRSAIRSGKHAVLKINQDLIKYGPHSFAVKVISVCPREELIKEETEVCRHYRSLGWRLYNQYASTNLKPCSLPSHLAPILVELAKLLDNEFISIEDVQALLNKGRENETVHSESTF